MRIAILFNPIPAVESAKYGSKYAHASMGFDYPMQEVNEQNIVLALKECIKVLEAKTVVDKELI